MRHGDKPHIVYGLVDPRDNSLFYVGITYQPKERLRHHNAKRYGGNPSFDRCMAIRKDGMKVQMKHIWHCHNRQSAVAIESVLVGALPKLVNIAATKA